MRTPFAGRLVEFGYRDELAAQRAGAARAAWHHALKRGVGIEPYDRWIGFIHSGT
jgi:hypothetical protein